MGGRVGGWASWAREKHQRLRTAHSCWRLLMQMQPPLCCCCSTSVPIAVDADGDMLYGISKFAELLT